MTQINLKNQRTNPDKNPKIPPRRLRTGFAVRFALAFGLDFVLVFAVDLVAAARVLPP
jgi:hypothetical protein